MSDKKMLNESTIRKMMKLANIPSLTDSFIKETYYNYAAVSEQEEEELDVELDDEPALDDAPMEEPEMDLELDVEEPAGGDLPAAEELVQDLMGVLEKHFEEIDFNVDVEGGEDRLFRLPVQQKAEGGVNHPVGRRARAQTLIIGACQGDRVARLPAAFSDCDGKPVSAPGLTSRLPPMSQATITSAPARH